MECPCGRGQFPLEQEDKGTIHMVKDIRILLKMEQPANLGLSTVTDINRNKWHIEMSLRQVDPGGSPSILG